MMKLNRGYMKKFINTVCQKAQKSMRLHGSITEGKIANLIITKEIPSVAHMPYSFGSNPIESVILNGKIIF